MTNWLKTFLPRKYAVIDGRQVTEPIINRSDTTFTVTGNSNWGSTSKYNVHLQGPNSYYQYKTLSEQQDDPSAGGARQEQITVTGNEPERLNRYRGYINSLAPEDYKYWWQQIFSKADGGKVEKGDEGTKISTNYDKNWLDNYLSQAPDSIAGFGQTGTYIRSKQTDGSYKYFVDPKNGGQYRYPLTESEWADNYLRSTGFTPKWDDDFENIIGAQTTNRDREPYGVVTKRTIGQKRGGKLYNEDLIAAIEACGGKIKKKLIRQGSRIIEVPFENK